MAILIVSSVEKEVGSKNPIPILKGVDLRVNQGETISIMGTSGSGKTTLLTLLAGLDLPTRGEIHLDGFSLTTMNEDERAKCRLGRVGFVFQNFDLLPNFTALENVMLPIELAGEVAPQEKARALLSQVGLENRSKHFPRQLSGGEQQRVAIARAFVAQPKILFADEPTGNLDTQTGEKIMDLLFNLNSQMRTTLIFVTHDAELSRRCQSRYLLDNGKLTSMATQSD